MIKYYYFASFKSVYFKKDSIIDFAIYYLQIISDPIRLKTIRQRVQLTAFLT